MTFPVWVPIGPWRLHPHLVMEMLAYATGFWLYRRFRRGGDVLEPTQRLTLLAATVVGAAVGSKLLAWLEDPAETLRVWSGGGAALFQGKSIVGGLLGGVVATEAVKKSLGIFVRTGDVYVVPLCVATAIGRVGCLLTGVSDRTCGAAAEIPWGMDLGDGVPRHPLPLYEVAVMACLTALFVVRRRLLRPPGALFREYLALYCGWRLLSDFLKPGAGFYAGLGGVQIAAVAGLWWAREGISTLLPRRSVAHG